MKISASGRFKAFLLPSNTHLTTFVYICTFGNLNWTSCVTDNPPPTNSAGLIGEPIPLGPQGPFVKDGEPMSGYTISVGVNTLDIGNPPISLRLGEQLALEVARRRRWPDESLAAIMRRDLERYYTTARETVLGLRLTREEAFLLVEALASERKRIPRFLWAVVDEWVKIAKPQQRAFPSRVDPAKVAATLVPKLRELSPLDAHALYDAVDLFEIDIQQHGLFHAALASGLTLEVSAQSDSDFGKQAVHAETLPARRTIPIPKARRAKK
jgi:hypothetical protein